MPSHLDDAVASLEIGLTDDEVAELEAPYTPPADFRGVRDDAELSQISARLGIKPAGGSAPASRVKSSRPLRPGRTTEINGKHKSREAAPALGVVLGWTHSPRSRARRRGGDAGIW